MWLSLSKQILVLHFAGLRRHNIVPTPSDFKMKNEKGKKTLPPPNPGFASPNLNIPECSAVSAAADKTRPWSWRSLRGRPAYPSVLLFAREICISWRRKFIIYIRNTHTRYHTYTHTHTHTQSRTLTHAHKQTQKYKKNTIFHIHPQ